MTALSARFGSNAYGVGVSGERKKVKGRA